MKKALVYIIPLLLAAGAAYYFLVHKKRRARGLMGANPMQLQAAANAAGTTAAIPAPAPTGKPKKKGWRSRLSAVGKSAFKQAVATQTGGVIRL